MAALAAPAASAETLQERCSSVAATAHSIMRAHQHGVALGVILAGIDEASSDPEVGAAITELALIAYGEPRYQTEAAQQRSADEFRDIVHVWCLS